MSEAEGRAEELTEQWQCVLHFSTEEKEMNERSHKSTDLKREWDGDEICPTEEMMSHC